MAATMAAADPYAAPPPSWQTTQKGHIKYTVPKIVPFTLEPLPLPFTPYIGSVIFFKTPNTDNHCNVNNKVSTKDYSSKNYSKPNLPHENWIRLPRFNFKKCNYAPGQEGSFFTCMDKEDNDNSISSFKSCISEDWTHNNNIYDTNNRMHTFELKLSPMTTPYKWIPTPHSPPAINPKFEFIKQQFELLTTLILQKPGP